MGAVAYCRRLDEPFAGGGCSRRRLSCCEITRGALGRLLASQLPRELDWTVADPLGGPLGTVLYGAVRSAHHGVDDERPRAVMPTARDDEQEVGP